MFERSRLAGNFLDFKGSGMATVLHRLSPKRGGLFMWNKAMWSVAIWIFLLGCFSPGNASTEDAMTELWKSESFIKKAQAIKAGDWEDVKPQDVAIAGLYEMGRAVNRLEGRFESELNRLYSFALIGVLVLAAYLVLQLVMTLVLILRVGRKSV
jgi:hypothetical protein